MKYVVKLDWQVNFMYMPPFCNTSCRVLCLQHCALLLQPMHWLGNISPCEAALVVADMKMVDMPMVPYVPSFPPEMNDSTFPVQNSPADIHMVRPGLMKNLTITAFHQMYTTKHAEARPIGRASGMWKIIEKTHCVQGWCFFWSYPGFWGTCRARPFQEGWPICAFQHIPTC